MFYHDCIVVQDIFIKRLNRLGIPCKCVMSDDGTNNCMLYLTPTFPERDDDLFEYATWSEN